MTIGDMLYMSTKQFYVDSMTHALVVHEADRRENA